MIVVCVDNRRVQSETADREAPIAIRDGRDGADTLCRVAELRAKDGRVLGRIGYWPERPIAMNARNPSEASRGVTVWLELDGEAVDMVPVD